MGAALPYGVERGVCRGGLSCWSIFFGIRDIRAEVGYAIARRFFGSRRLVMLYGAL